MENLDAAEKDLDAVDRVQQLPMPSPVMIGNIKQADLSVRKLHWLQANYKIIK